MFRYNLSVPSSIWFLDPWRWDREVAPKRRQGTTTTTTRCVRTQKSAVLVYFAAEAWNHSNNFRAGFGSFSSTQCWPLRSPLGSSHSAPSERSISSAHSILARASRDFSWFVVISWHLIPFNTVLNFGKRRKSHGVTACEYGGCVKAAILCLSKNFTHRQSRVRKCIVMVEKPIHRIEFISSFSPLVVPQTLWWCWFTDCTWRRDS